MESVLLLFALISFGFLCFSIYFIFKVLQFVIEAINLYKKMINRQDKIIQLLQGKAIEGEGALGVEKSEADEQETEKHIFCSNCGKKLPATVEGKSCSGCNAIVS